MKPINRDDEFTVQECLDAIREECKTCDFNYGRVWLLADRIEELTRWIPASERLPTPEDGYQIHVMDGFGIAFTIMQSQWDSYEPTHWKRIDSPF